MAETINSLDDLPAFLDDLGEDVGAILHPADAAGCRCFELVSECGEVLATSAPLDVARPDIVDGLNDSDLLFVETVE